MASIRDESVIAAASRTERGDTVAAPPVPVSRHRWTRWLPFASIVVSLVAWELSAHYLLPNSLFFVPVSAVLRTFYLWFAEGTILPHLWVSGQELAIGFFLAGIVGVVVGGAMGASTLARGVLSPWVAFLYATPLVAVAPLFVLVLGIDLASKVALVFTLSVFPIIVNTAAGFLNAQDAYLELARAFHASRWAQIRKILIPSSLPFILSGFRLASGKAVIGVVVGEFFVSRAGVGFLIKEASTTFRIEMLFAGVLLLGTTGFLLFSGFEYLEKRLAPWRAES